MRELLAYAASRGIAVHVAHLPHPYRGYFDPDSRTIVYEFNLTPIERRVVLAHELGHAHHGHTCENDRDAEELADLFAARLLISADEYARAERATSDPHTLAEDLGVTPDILEVYQRRCLTKLRGVTYARAGIGAGQWNHRYAHA